MFTKKNLEQIENQGFTVEDVLKQVDRFKQGFPQIDLSSPAITSHGIKVLSDEDESRFISVFENSLASGLNAMKFVPASGAASRMFKKLFEFLNDEINEDDDFIRSFFENLEQFAFFEDLKVDDSQNKKKIVEALLSENKLGYGIKPKGQLIFHKYSKGKRTPFEEHLVEAVSYCTGSKGIAKVHFTVSKEHKKGFEEILNRVATQMQKRFGVKIDVSFSFQHSNTDTIAVDLNNVPFLDNSENIVFRPGGHGALIQNLNELDSDVIFIKNIDNVVPDRLKPKTKHYKKALAGLLVTIRNDVFKYIDKLSKPDAVNDIELLKKAENFIRKNLFIEFKIDELSNDEKHQFLIEKLNRPIRICGMVRNEGEPGGGPFWVKNEDGTVSLQIVEKAQINLENENQVQFLSESTHFNPVDLICCTKNSKGEKFDLNEFIDQDTGFISTKSINGKSVKALELPGLWNGAMSNWNTIFVEVPIETFNPVKTVNDLLRPEHQQ